MIFFGAFVPPPFVFFDALAPLPLDHIKSRAALPLAKPLTMWYNEKPRESESHTGNSVDSVRLFRTCRGYAERDKSIRAESFFLQFL